MSMTVCAVRFDAPASAVYSDPTQVQGHHGAGQRRRTQLTARMALRERFKPPLIRVSRLGRNPLQLGTDTFARNGQSSRAAGSMGGVSFDVASHARSSKILPM